MQRDFYRRGQGILEYSILIICIAAGLLAMQYYVKRAIQGRVRQSADSIGEQYSPGHMEESTITTTQKGKTTVEAKQVWYHDPITKKLGLALETTTTIGGEGEGEGEGEEFETTTRKVHEKVEKFERDLFD